MERRRRRGVSPAMEKQHICPADAAVATVVVGGGGKIPFRPRKIRKLSSGDTKKEAAGAPVVIRRPLTAAGEIAAALLHLRTSDPHLAPLIDAHDPPSFQPPTPYFASLARGILYQQLAVKAAATIHSRFVSLCGGESSVAPAAVLALTPDQLRQIGVSGRKASYIHDLARNYAAGFLSDAAIAEMDDNTLLGTLTAVKGIGPWSVHMFMMFSLHRPDVLPVGDLGVRKGVQMLYGLKGVPEPGKMEELCDAWRPYRSVGTWYMWRLLEAKGTATIATTVP